MNARCYHLIVAQIMNYRNLIGISLCVVLCGCEEHQERCDPPRLYTSVSFVEETRFLEKFLGDDFMLDWENLTGYGCEDKYNKGHFQINWYRGACKQERNLCMIWSFVNGSLTSMSLYFYLGRTYPHLDDVWYESEQCIHITISPSCDDIFWTVSYAEGSDQITDIVVACMEEVWTLNPHQDRGICNTCPIARHQEFSNILSRALQMNGFNKPFCIGGRNSKDFDASHIVESALEGNCLEQ